MKRLTRRLADGRACFKPHLYGQMNKDVCDRLAAYEDTGLEPCDYSAMAHALEQAERAREDLTEMIRQIGATGLDRLRELAQAEKENRVLPEGSGWFVTCSGKKLTVVMDIEAALRREQDEKGGSSE